MVSRATILQLLIAARGDTYFMQEQPGNSLMWLHRRQKQLRLLLQHPPEAILYNLGGWHKTHTWMGAFGAATPKLSHLKGNFGGIPELMRSMTRAQIVARSAEHPTARVNARNRALGRPAVTGIPSRVRETQGYTATFGRAVVETWERFQPAPNPLVLNPDVELPDQPLFLDVWEDLNLRNLAGKLNLPYDRLAV